MFLTRRMFSTQRLMVIGSGQMGGGIAYAAVFNGQIPTILHDTNTKALRRSVDLIKKLLEKQVTKGKLKAEEVESRLALLETSSDFVASVDKADIVIEAVPEQFDLKAAIFTELARLTKSKNTILASNTSSISVTRLAAAAKGAENRVIGLHFFNPVPVLKGVEVIRALQTCDEVHDAGMAFMKKLGKIPSSSLDSPGFLANRILIPMINEACMLLESGTGDAHAIDSIMKNGCGFPMGPLELADLIGLDTVLAVVDVLLHETGDSKFRSANILRNYVAAGFLGRKSGRGFYDYSSGSKL